MSETTDFPHWIADAIRGDRSALQKLLLSQYPSLIQHIRPRIPPRVRSQLIAEDVIQQTVVRVLGSIKHCAADSEASFRAWLKTIAENCLKDAIRQVDSKKRGGSSMRVQSEHASIESSFADLVDLLSAGSHTPSRSVARHEAVAAVRRSIEALAPDYRRAVELRFLQGKSLDETAAMLGRSPRAVQGLVDRARKKMRADLERFSS